MADKDMASRGHQSRKRSEEKDFKLSKSEREKMKRENLNDRFLALANALDISEQTNGQACILGEATRMIMDTLKQIQRLRKENEALMSESQYVTNENNELQLENSAMQDQIEKLQKVLKEKTSCVNLDLNIAPPELKEQDVIPLIAEEHITLPTVGSSLRPPPDGTPVYVIGVCPAFPVNQQANYNAQIASQNAGNVSKPHARYPSPGESWPSRLR